MTACYLVIHSASSFLQVDSVQGLQALGNTVDVGGNTFSAPAGGAVGGPGNVRGCDDVRQFEERIIRIDRLGGEYVQRSAPQAPLRQSLVERLLIHQRTASHVDQTRGGLQQAEPARVEDVPCPSIQM